MKEKVTDEQVKSARKIAGFDKEEDVTNDRTSAWRIHYP